MYVEINGKNFSPLITEIKRKFKIIYSDNTGETLDRSMSLDPMGTKVYYTLTVDSLYKDQELLESFWNELSAARKTGFNFKAPYNQTEIEFRAYAEEGEQSLFQSQDGKNIWGKISVDILPIKPQF